MEMGPRTLLALCAIVTFQSARAEAECYEIESYKGTQPYHNDEFTRLEGVACDSHPVWRASLPSSYVQPYLYLYYNSSLSVWSFGDTRCGTLVSAQSNADAGTSPLNTTVWLEVVGSGNEWKETDLKLRCLEYDRDCEVASIWSDWDDCSVQCGSGTQSREKEITQTQAGLGKPCGTIPTEDRVCDTGIDCASVCEWTPWSHCTFWDKQTRERRARASYPGLADYCSRQSGEEQHCNDAISMGQGKKFSAMYVLAAMFIWMNAY